VTAMLEARALGLRYGRRRAVTDCTLTIPPGRVTGLVGPNGAGKSTLLELARGLLSPTSGRIRVLGGTPGSGPGQLVRVGFAAQDAPVYPTLSVAGHLRLGAHLNPGRDRSQAHPPAAVVRHGLVVPACKGMRSGPGPPSRAAGSQPSQLRLTNAAAAWSARSASSSMAA
jgi:ABC-type multidrug transport system ATPase subunit